MATLEDLSVRVVGDSSRELKHNELRSKVLDDMEDELILELGLCSGPFCFLLLGTEAIENAGCLC